MMTDIIACIIASAVTAPRASVMRAGGSSQSLRPPLQRGASLAVLLQHLQGLAARNRCAGLLHTLLVYLEWVTLSREEREAEQQERDPERQLPGCEAARPTRFHRCREREPNLRLTRIKTNKTRPGASTEADTPIRTRPLETSAWERAAARRADARVLASSPPSLP